MTSLLLSPVLKRARESIGAEAEAFTRWAMTAPERQHTARLSQLSTEVVFCIWADLAKAGTLYGPGKRLRDRADAVLTSRQAEPWIVLGTGVSSTFSRIYLLHCRAALVRVKITAKGKLGTISVNPKDRTAASEILAALCAQMISEAEG